MRQSGFTVKGSCRAALVLWSLLVLAPACAAAGELTLKIDPKHVTGLQNMRSEITSMLEGLGYEWLPVHDPAIGQPVQVSQENGQFVMLFRATDNASMQINVHIRKYDNVTGLHFIEQGTDQPGGAALNYFNKLKERVILEFGADNVSVTHSFMTP
jgi:hypothetical protein